MEFVQESIVYIHNLKFMKKEGYLTIILSVKFECFVYQLFRNFQKPKCYMIIITVTVLTDEGFTTLNI